MRKIIKTLLVVMALALVITAFTGCEFIDKIVDMITPAPAECVHQGGTATCTEAAICELCGEPYGEALGHTAELLDAVEPTCEGTGLTSGSKCKVCGEILEAQEEIPAKGHTAATDAAVEATCSSTGLTEGSHCSVCDKVLVAQETTEKLAHTPVVDEAVEATCSSTGLTEGSHCSVCNEVIVAQEVVDALAHTFTFVTTLPTADAAGSTTATCSVCEHSVTFDSVNVMGEGTYVLDAADLAGIAQYSLYDGEVKVVNGLFECHLSAKYRTDDKTTEFSDGWFSTHRMNFGGKTEFKSNGMIKNGIVFTTAGDATVKIWWVEGGDDSRQIALYNMNGEIVAQTEDVLSKNDTCVSVLTVPAGTYVLGNVVNTNYHFRVEVTVAAPHTHDYEAVVTAPTCTEKGYTTYTCDCGDTYKADEVDALGHNMIVDEAKAPTCTETGLTEGSHCSRCDHKVAQEVVPATGHDYDAVVTAPTCTEKGYTTYTCDCGDTYKADEVAATGHAYVDGVCGCSAIDPDHYFVVSIPEALEKADGFKVEVSGTVSSIGTAWSDSYGNISVTIVDAEGNELYVYRMKTNVALGDIITVKGAMGTHEGDKQIAAGSTAVITGHDSSYDYNEATIPEAIVAEDGTNVIVTGTVVEINTAYSSQYGNISVTIADENGNKLYIYRLDGGKDLALNDIIEIKGTMDTFNGSKQVAGGTYTEVGVHECSNYSEATCQKLSACVVCGATTGELANHNYVDGTCTICGGSENVTVKTASMSIFAKKGSLAGKTITWTCDAFTFSNSQAKSTSAIRTSDSDHFRVYAKSEVTISGSKMTKVVITCTSSSYATACKNSVTTKGVTVTVSGSVVTITVDSGTVDAINFTSTAQWRLKSVEVTYQE